MNLQCLPGIFADYLDEEEYQALQNELDGNPETGDLMPNTGGFRKLRWADPRRGKGRRGGLRIIYYYFSSDRQIWLMTLYSKDEAADLTPKEKKNLRDAIETELNARKAKLAKSRQKSKSRRIQ